MSPGVSAGSLGAGIGGTGGFVSGKGGIGIALHFENHRVTRMRRDGRVLSSFTGRLRSITAMRGTTGLRNEGVDVILTRGHWSGVVQSRSPMERRGGKKGCRTGGRGG